MTFEDMLAIVQPHNDKLIAEGRLAEAERQLGELRAAAERVCWFDWSHNDEDAARAVDDLRKLVSR